MSAVRGEFSSRLGFVLAASGSAVGLGNIWGFPTQAASNGGGAFLLVYLLLTFLLAYPALMAELVIGRFAKANSVTAIRKLSSSSSTHSFASLTGYGGLATASLVLTFYAVVAGWMLANLLAAIARIAGQQDLTVWLSTNSLERDILSAAVFVLLTISIICAGVVKGIERWSTRLMPSLLIILVSLAAYVMTLEGAGEGLRAYLIPDFSAILDPDLIVSAMGQSFFSLSIGAGSMLIYGSYISKQSNLPRMGLAVAMIDVGIAVLAGLLILPAIYVAQANGVAIFDNAGGLVGGPAMIFSILPNLFESMGVAGNFVAVAFFALMTIAALTSSISMLEVPVSYAVEYHRMPRVRATWLIAGSIFVVSVLIILNSDWLLDLVVTIVTQYMQPLVALAYLLFVGWIWRRDQLLQELKSGCPDLENGWFWRLWPFYVRFICPLGILVIFLQSIL